ncbi:four-helix bundle copper-binding protein [uncultured Dechloromonas sp.]|uniref:four-helix bundle copper-binding protein n=1 Tax=uncultured Dechloromonas sp. TaxID=171719 RepID=UPI0025E7D503|nr:four-helix bundle copper-binding protein [uncultured Dechloromonas sp.]
MERREVLKTVAATVAGAISSAALAADHDHHHAPAGMAPRNAGLIAASADCLKTGEACLAHCLYLLGNGDREMAACAQSVNELLASCTALMKLAGQDSKHVPGFAKLAAEICASCEKECRKHEKHHAECKACADSCAACLKECKRALA